jgi:hypothetical protein
MVQVVIDWSFIIDAWAQHHAGQCGICGEQKGTGTGFFAQHATQPSSVSIMSMINALSFICYSPNGSTVK